MYIFLYCMYIYSIQIFTSKYIEYQNATYQLVLCHVCQINHEKRRFYQLFPSFSGMIAQPGLCLSYFPIICQIAICQMVFIRYKSMK